MKDFYLRKLGRRGKIMIWLVDGRRIRSKLDEEFTNYGQHFRFPFIPEDEFWLDREAVPNERKFFLDHLLVEWRLQKAGYSYSYAAGKANRKERAERKKSKDLKKIKDKDGRLVHAKVHCRLIKKIHDGLTVWLVHGRLVRSAFDIEFTEGGHDLVYRYVPKKEVWIDNDVVASERLYVILHELYERSLMARGLSYKRAHNKASLLEWRARHNEKKLERFLRQAGWE